MLALRMHAYTAMLCYIAGLLTTPAVLTDKDFHMGQKGKDAGTLSLELFELRHAEPKA